MHLNVNSEVEFLRMLKVTCKSVRGGSRLDLVGAASEWEQRINARLAEIGVSPDDVATARRRRNRRSAVTLPDSMVATTAGGAA